MGRVVWGPVHGLFWTKDSPENQTQWVSDLSAPSGITLEVASKMTATCVPPKCLLLISLGCGLGFGIFKISQVVLTCSQVQELQSEGEHDLAPKQHTGQPLQGDEAVGRGGVGWQRRQQKAAQLPAHLQPMALHRGPGVHGPAVYQIHRGGFRMPMAKLYSTPHPRAGARPRCFAKLSYR